MADDTTTSNTPDKRTTDTARQNPGEQVPDRKIEAGGETYTLPKAVAPANHGGTVAGWTFMYVVLGGVLIVAIGMMVNNLAVMIAGVVVCILGGVIGAVLKGMGYGQAPTSAPQRSDDWYADQS